MGEVRINSRVLLGRYSLVWQPIQTRLDDTSIRDL